MTNTLTETVCLHCGSALPSSDLAAGWCDSCGKRLPGSYKSGAKAAQAATAVADQPDPRRLPFLLGAVAFFIVVPLAGLLYLARLAG